MFSRILSLLSRRVDDFLLTCLISVMVVGLVVLYSASGSDVHKITNQLFNISVALIAMWLLAQFPPQTFERYAWHIYTFVVLLLILVILIGSIKNGAKRWIALPLPYNIQLQPSELMRIAMPMVLAWYFARCESTPTTKHFIIAFALLLLPISLIINQPDLGTALLVGISGGYVIFLAGLSWRFCLSTIVLLVISMPTLWLALHDYQRKRIEILLDPSQDPLGAGYHVIQSVIAIGSGGSWGKGWLAGTQAQLDFIPERTTDFIFAVFAEEFGLIGIMLLLILFSLITARGFLIAYHAKGTFSRLLAGSIALTFFTYVFVNMGMVSGFLPVVGVPLPLVSYGGSAMITLCVSFGILMSIHTHRGLVTI